MDNYGVISILSIVSHLIFIGLAWWALQAIQIEKLLRKNRVTQARLLFLLLAIALGSAVSNFFLDYFFWTQQIPFLFR